MMHIGMQSYRKKRGYIATQWPLDDTLNDFWGMVSQRKVPAIILLDSQPCEVISLSHLYKL